MYLLKQQWMMMANRFLSGRMELGVKVRSISGKGFYICILRGINFS